jgi:hypothetical protein
MPSADDVDGMDVAARGHKADDTRCDLSSIERKLGEQIMTTQIIIGVEGDPSLWLIDLENRSVERLDDDFAGVRVEGGRVVRGVDLAVAAPVRSQAASHQLSPSRSPEAEPVMRGIDVAVATSVRSQAASHQLSPSRSPEAEPVMRGIDVAVATGVRSQAASHQLSPSR